MNDMDNNEVQQDEAVEPEISEEELKEREQLFNGAIERVNNLGLNWTFRSIEFIVNREGITFNQLRSCVFNPLPFHKDKPSLNASFRTAFSFLV